MIRAAPSQSVEALLWQGKQLYSAGLMGHVTKYSLNELKPEVKAMDMLYSIQLIEYHRVFLTNHLMQLSLVST